jgi:hypothetical protein
VTRLLFLNPNQRFYNACEFLATNPSIACIAMPLSHSSSIFKKSLMYLLQNDDRKKSARLRGAEAAHGHLKPK